MKWVNALYAFKVSNKETKYSYYIETSKLICRANELTGFYVICIFLLNSYFKVC